MHAVTGQEQQVDIAFLGALLEPLQASMHVPALRVRQHFGLDLAVALALLRLEEGGKVRGILDGEVELGEVGRGVVVDADKQGAQARQLQLARLGAVPAQVIGDGLACPRHLRGRPA